MRQIIRSILLGAALACAAWPSFAQWYVGASAGESRASLRGGLQADQLLELGFLGASTTIDDKDTMYRLHAGYRLHRHFAVELAYADLGKSLIRSTVVPTGSLETSVRSEGAELSAVGMLPVGGRLALFARAGAFAARTKASYSGDGSVRLVDGQQEQTRRSTHAVYGAGATYDFTPNLGLRVEWCRYDKLGDEFTGGEHDARVLSAGIQWRF
jgi:OOP family OmpA-OmpF porin